MTSGESKCTCGNIRFIGKQVPPGCTPRINAYERNLIRGYGDVYYEVKPNSITIKSLPKAGIRTRSETCFDLICLKCSCEFLCCFSRSFIFIAPHESSRQEERKTTLIRPLSAFSPAKFVPYLRTPASTMNPKPKTQNPPEKRATQIPDDSDFDIMFGRTRGAIVGSFTPQLAELPEDLFT
ncbi:hypothetical protein GPJ56_007745 [Histomonas meleagridis]|uniref:uncharacterized protein n=1 Tax=Histomonas meleagridis TaxID=135588 RepID=UPI00355AAD60|nr:hypothetical protein GPJ56_007745 [Histomonas meleagridis]KAH0798777.1 hypothetical protein GO595_008642 [Histomonas meleagridis]